MRFWFRRQAGGVSESGTLRETRFIAAKPLHRKKIRDAGLEIGGRGAFDAENGVLTVMPKCP